MSRIIAFLNMSSEPKLIWIIEISSRVSNNSIIESYKRILLKIEAFIAPS